MNKRPNDLGDEDVKLNSRSDSKISSSDELNSYKPKDPKKLRIILEESFGVTVKSIELLSQALTHRSAKCSSSLKDKSNFSKHYEQLEFLGDAVLDLIVAQIVINKFPKAPEGVLSKMRSALVNTTSLAEVAVELGLNQYIIVGKGESSLSSVNRPSLLADITEAIFGAIFLESGIMAATKIAEIVFIPKLKRLEIGDPKSNLQEKTHALGLGQPIYEITKTLGPEHRLEFVSIVKVAGSILGTGKGSSKKSSEKIAASEALKTLALDKKAV